MIEIELINIKNLNTSLQVGDMIYVTAITGNMLSGNDKRGADINANNRVGVLRKIEQIASNSYKLHIDNSGFNATVNTGDFIMFSKYNQSDGDIKGYYMEVKLVNNSREKVELFSISSEVTESSR